MKSTYIQGDDMVQIVVTAEQALKIESSGEAIEIVDDSGKRIGFFTKPFSDAEIEEAKYRAANEPIGRTTKEVLERLSKLDSA
ncbi:hypothetical protein Q31b_36170 [Novipirellula aureliae]|uniref:Uncharacterized protein n=1 Tax=Novipirellula aureliae TaxID=2527966 RepID=A0A5C6DUB0_9BACT|nr:hypothetical protein [Novipirellula aureliae]TWU40270.1 hypothetical protein Q31b_36170 [Novipirellula aureliae]